MTTQAVCLFPGRHSPAAPLTQVPTKWARQGTLHGRGGPPTTMNICDLTPEPDELDNDNIVNLDPQQQRQARRP
ncbi:hypothetical protein ZWY2020_020954 [Hordeum vulgare]|nr:hypothetical protein ZWY2020_020954 [Hordeum vulgare]